MSEIALSDIINCMKNAYKSIDLRIAVGKEDDKWHNGLTVIRFSYQDKKSVENKIKGIESRIGEVKTDNFFISHHIFAFNELEELLSQFRAGKINLDDTEIDLGRSINLLSLKNHFSSHFSSHRLTRKLDEWNVLEVFDGRHSEIFGKAEKEIGSLGFSDIYDPVNEWLEMSNFSGSISVNIVVSAPFYAIIKDVDFEGQTAEVKIKLHENLNDLILHLLLRKKEHSGAIKLRSSFNMDKNEIRELNGNFKLWEKKVELPSATTDDFLIIKLAQKELSEVDSFRKPINDFIKIKEPAMMPFFSTFSRFCGEEDFIKHLTQPHEIEIKGIKGMQPQDVFERAVSWLLNLSSFPSVKLDEYEKLRERKVELGSVDILAYNKDKNQLLLVNCTLGIPKPNEIDSYNSVKTVLYDELFKGTSLQIIPIIFSAKREISLMKDEGERVGVRIFGLDDIEKILKYIKNRDADLIVNMIEGKNQGG